MSIVNSIAAFANRAGEDVGNLQELLNGRSSDLSALTTTQKSNLVVALNEVNATINSAIDDGATNLASTWSSSKINEEINAEITSATNSIIANAPGALNTLNEIAAALNDDPNVVSTLLSQQAKRVAVNTTQSFTTAEKLQGCNNLGIGDPETSFLIEYQTARDS